MLLKRKAGKWNMKTKQLVENASFNLLVFALEETDLLQHSPSQWKEDAYSDIILHD